MKTAILGAGAMGCLIGAHLKKGGTEVWLCDPWQEHMEAVNANGICMEIEGRDPESVRVDGAVTDPSVIGICDLAIVLCKCTDTGKTLEKASAVVGGQTVLVTLQNGIGNISMLEKAAPVERLGLGVLKASATLRAPGRIIGRTVFSPGTSGLYYSAAGDPSDNTLQILQEMGRCLNRAGFPSEMTDRTESLIWEKMYLNIMYNMPCALLQVAGEDFMRQPEGEKLLRRIAEEYCAVANAKGFSIDAEKYWNMYGAPDIAKLGPEVRHYTSAVIDACRQRETEAEFITGAVVREAKRMGIDVPCNETVYCLIKVMEKTYSLRYTP